MKWYGEINGRIQGTWEDERPRNLILWTWEMRKMNHKPIPAVAAFLILGVLLSAGPLAYATKTLVLWA